MTLHLSLLKEDQAIMNNINVLQEVSWNVSREDGGHGEEVHEWDRIHERRETP